MAAYPGEGGVGQGVKNLVVHAEAFFVGPDVTLVALYAHLPFFTGAFANGTGELVIGAWVAFNVSCQQEKAR